MEFFLFNEKKERLLQENKKEEERKYVERQIIEDSQASRMADDEVRIQEFMTKNELLQSELHSAEKQLETLKVFLYFVVQFIIYHLILLLSTISKKLFVYVLRCVCCMYVCMCVCMYVCVCLCVIECAITVLVFTTLYLIHLNESDCFRRHCRS